MLDKLDYVLAGIVVASLAAIIFAAQIGLVGDAYEVVKVAFTTGFGLLAGKKVPVTL